MVGGREGGGVRQNITVRYLVGCSQSRLAFRVCQLLQREVLH